MPLHQLRLQPVGARSSENLTRPVRLCRKLLVVLESTGKIAPNLSLPPSKLKSIEICGTQDQRSIELLLGSLPVIVWQSTLLSMEFCTRGCDRTAQNVGSYLLLFEVSLLGIRNVDLSFQFAQRFLERAVSCGQISIPELCKRTIQREHVKDRSGHA